MEILAIDIGYGDTKVAAHLKPFSFKSGYAPFRVSDVGVGNSYGITITLSDNKTENLFASTPIPKRTFGPFIVGDKSTFYPGYTEPVGNARLGSDDALPLLGEAILRSGLEGDIVLSTGAPLDLYSIEKESAQKWLDNTITVESTDGRKTTVCIKKIVTRPQGVAAAIALTSLHLMPVEHGIGVVVDIGSRTTDVVSLALSPSDIDPIRPLCFSIPVGVGDLFNFISEGIGRELKGFRPQRAQVQSLMGKDTFKLGDKSCALKPIVEQARKSVMTSLGNEIRRRFGEQASLVVAIAAVGGGALPNLFGPSTSMLFPGIKPLEISAEDAVYMNAAGYLVAAAK